MGRQLLTLKRERRKKFCVRIKSFLTKKANKSVTCGLQPQSVSLGKKLRAEPTQTITPLHQAAASICTETKEPQP